MTWRPRRRHPQLGKSPLQREPSYTRSYNARGRPLSGGSHRACRPSDLRNARAADWEDSGFATSSERVTTTAKTDGRLDQAMPENSHESTPAADRAEARLVPANH